jgi:hypothetical protein
MARHEDRIGKAGQIHAASVLSGLGVNMVEPIGTPAKYIPYAPNGRIVPGVYRVIFGEKVSGDHRGIMDNGISVLIETKTILDRNLRYSDLIEHQPIRLSQHALHHGISLLVWVHDTGIYVMRFPIDGFEPGKSISPSKADAEHRSTIEYLNEV